MPRTRRHARIWVCLAAAVAISSAVLLVRADSPSPPKFPSPALELATESQLPAIEPEPRTSVEIPTENATRAGAEIAPASPIPAGESGLLVGMDPETGRIGKPSAEARARMAEHAADPALDRSMEGIEIVHRPDGSMMADLKGRFQDYTIIRITPDGRRIESCVQGPQLEAALQATDAPAPAPQHEVR